MTIRVYGNLLHTVGAWTASGAAVERPRPFTEEDIADWMATCARHGATAVLWQANNGGLWTHPSPVFPLAGPPFREHNEAYAPVWTYLGEQLRSFNSLRAAVRLCHANGMRFVYAFCPCDFVDSPFEESLFHPNLWMLSRRGEPFHGVPCYAEPKVQEIVLAHLRDVLEAGTDDLAISFFSHLQNQGTDQPGYYGFNPQVVEAYRARYGKDPRLSIQTAAALDSVYGDFYTEFMRKLKHETAVRGQRFIPCTSYNGRWGWGGTGGMQVFNHCNVGAPAPSVAPSCGIEYQFTRWAQQGLADALMVIAPPRCSIEAAREITRDTGLPVLLWHKIPASSTAEDWSCYYREAAEAKRGTIRGYVVHASTIVAKDELTLRLWDLLESGS